MGGVLLRNSCKCLNADERVDLAVAQVHCPAKNRKKSTSLLRKAEKVNESRYGRPLAEEHFSPDRSGKGCTGERCQCRIVDNLKRPEAAGDVTYNRENNVRKSTTRREALTGWTPRN